MSNDDQAAGTSLSTLRSDLRHILVQAQVGSETYARSIQEATGAGNGALADFFRQIQQEDLARVTAAQKLLGQMPPDAGDGSDDDGDDRGSGGSGWMG